MRAGGRSSEAPARGFDVNRAPSAAASAFAALEEEDDEEEEEDPGAGALSSSSPNDSAGSFPLDLGRRAAAHAEAAAARACGERSSSRASDEDEGASAARKKLRLSKEQSAFLEESFKEHSTLNPVSTLPFQSFSISDRGKLALGLDADGACRRRRAACRSRRRRWRSS